MVWLIGITSFVGGVYTGMTVASWAYNSQNWQVMKWCDSALGYRPVSARYKIKDNDRLVIALNIEKKDIEVNEDEGR